MGLAAVNLVKGALAALVALLVFVQVVVVPFSASGTMTAFPEVTAMWVPGVVWAVLAIACVQIALLTTWHLLTAAHARGSIRDVARAPVNVYIGTAAAFVALMAVGFVTLQALSWSPPLVTLVIVGEGALGVVILLALLGLRRRLPKAAATT